MNWQLYFWRTKDGEEIDFVLKTSENSIHAFEAKLAIHNVPQTIAYPPAFQKHFSPQTPLTVITFGGKKLRLSDYCQTLPITELHAYLNKLLYILVILALLLSTNISAKSIMSVLPSCTYKPPTLLLLDALIASSVKIKCYFKNSPCQRAIKVERSALSFAVK